MLTPAEVLSFYVKNNFRLVYWPAVGDTKGPREKGWTEKVYSLDDYREGYRVGILCGQEIAPGKYLSDVDIDWGAGSSVAQSLLPPTDFMFGRTTKKLSHCWYTTPEPLPSFKYEDPVDKSCLIELRGTKLDGTLGNQTMAPPSVWSRENAREPLEFVRMQVPTHLEASALLKRRVTLSAVAMLLARYFGKQGFGHEMRLAWAGFMLRAEVTVDECVLMGTAIMSYTGNADRTDVRLSIDSTFKRLGAGDKKVKGGPALAKMLGTNGPAIIKRINEWLGRDSDFIRDQNGRILKDHQENIARAISMLDIELSYNEFSNKMLVNKTRALEDDQLDDMWLRMDSEFRFRPSSDFFLRVVKHLCYQNSFHPVRDYFATLTWDGVARLDDWLVTAASASSNEYVRSVSAIVLIAAVRRIRHPGCKYDELLVLESAQGLQKSSALRALCPNPDWFSDDFQLNATSQRMIESTLGKWIIEVSELSGMRQSLIEMLKSNLSRQVDGPARMAYARMAIERPRQFILIGTTNSDAYLVDNTGARRFWPVKVNKFDVEWIVANRDQLWAEAVQREAAGESCRLPEHLWCLAGDEQEKRREVDPWEGNIKHGILDNPEFHAHSDGRTRVLTSFLWTCVAVLTDKQTRREAVRISETMQRLGFTRTKLRPRGEHVQVGYVSNMENWPAFIAAQDAHADDVEAQEQRGRDDHTPF